MSVVAVIGLGYVGLPLVVEFGKHLRTIGFDIAVNKVESCLKGVDPSRELSDEEMAASPHAVYTADPLMLAEADIIIVAVPTPVDNAHIPDFRPLVGSSTSVGRHMKKGAIVVYESTVYPGATEEVCIPVLERESGMKWKQDFFVGYSPERINPGDKEHTLTKILKIVSGDTPETLEKVAKLYETIIIPGVHRASSIKTAEAAKVIENTQRDLNISLMNELSIIFDKLGIDTTEVLEAAGTKWNFLKFKPGLVGGHCIGVDPYYLTHKAEMLGYNPQVILAGRRINDGMGKFIAEQTIKHMIAGGSYVKGAKVNVLGLTFKENCGDLRNSKVIDIINELKTYGVEVFVTDPQAKSDEAVHEYGVPLLPWDELPRADAIVAAVAHKEFAALSMEDFSKKLVKGGAFIDVKENCGDLRNSKVIDIINELKTYGVEVFVTDPQAKSDEAVHEYGVPLLPWDELPRADAIVAAVAHKEFAALSMEDFSKKLVKGGAFIDVKAAFDAKLFREAGYQLWRL